MCDDSIWRTLQEELGKLQASAKVCGSREKSIAITKLEESIMWLEKSMPTPAAIEA